MPNFSAYGEVPVPCAVVAAGRAAPVAAPAHWCPLLGLVRTLQRCHSGAVRRLRLAAGCWRAFMHASTCSPYRFVYCTVQLRSPASSAGWAFSSTHSFRTCKTQSVPRNHALCQKFGSGPVHVCVAFRWDRTKLVPVQTLAGRGMRVGKWNRMWWIPLLGSSTCLPHMHWAHRYRYRLGVRCV